MSHIRDFSVHVPDHELDDLRRRLAGARLLPDSPRRRLSGMTGEYLAELAGSWHDLDWRARERWLNAHPQFLAEIDDTMLHFAHLRSGRTDAPALLVMHGWPHSYALQLEFADLLPDFHVILPSLPGFAFSSPYSDGPMSERRLAETMHALMTDVLGYERYLTYGEDVSANVNDLLAALHPEAVQGILVTHAHLPSHEERARLTAPEEVAFFERLAAAQRTEGAYAHLQATRPDTLAAALNDSPAGLLAWVAEKLVEWSDAPTERPEEIERSISRERILTEAMIYWVTQSIGTSFRPYFDAGGSSDPIPPVEVPASIHIQRHEADYPESFARSFYRDIRFFERLEAGGHFAVAEVPGPMAERVRVFAQGLSLL